jgi:ATP-binding cassette subfamily B protein/subfamily B ATP-binding cassette protein MsbA
MNLAFLWQRARPFVFELALISAATILGSAALLSIPWLAGQLLGGLAGDGTVQLGPTLGLLIAALIAMTGLNILVAILSELASGRILAGLRREAYGHLQALPVSFHDQHANGDLIALMTYEVDRLTGFLTQTLATLPSMLLTAGGAIVLLFVLDPVMALVVPVLVPVFYLMMKLLARRLRTLAMRVRAADVKLYELASSDLQMLPAIKAFASEEQHRAHYAEAIEDARRLHLTQARISAFIGPSIALIAALAAIGILAFGGTRIAAGERDAGDLFAFLLYAALLTRPVGALANLYGNYQLARGALERLVGVFSQPAEPGYRATGRLERARGGIAFERIRFAYPGRDVVLDGLDLAIAPGEIVALTGENGVGKSTLIRLLLRYYDPQEGRITLDGQDIREIQVQDLRRQFGYVPQRPLLFNGTIRDNIAFGIAAAAPDRIERAARMSEAWNFIAKLPQGLDTVIGEHGIRLSGGQRQRIALARALFHDPPIYIFDEATSMYDLDSEAAFVETCIHSLKDRTVIIITHRPASLALADRVLAVSATGYRETDCDQAAARQERSV